MFTIYPLILRTLCVLVLIEFIAPALGEETPTGGGSGGMSEVQRRLDEGGEAESQSRSRLSTKVEVSAKQLSTTVAQIESAHPEWRSEPDFQKLISIAAGRSLLVPEMPADDLAAALDSINRSLEATKEHQETAFRLAKTVVFDIGHPNEFPIQRDPTRALIQTLIYKSPSKYAKAVLDGSAATKPAVVDTQSLQQFYDRLTGTEKPLTVLKNDREFLLVQPSGKLELFADDTQYLTMSINVDGKTVKQRPSADEGYGARLRGSAHALQLTNDVVLTGDEVVCRLKVTNQSNRQTYSRVAIEFSSDFKDMFEVRGWQRKKRGDLLGADVSRPRQTTKLRYRGLDRKLITTDLQINGIRADKLDSNHVEIALNLSPAQSRQFEIVVVPSPAKLKQISYATAKYSADLAWKRWKENAASIETDNADFNRAIDQGLKDIYILKQRTEGGEAIAAGTPWFAAPFGRDQLITSLEMLPFKPEIAKNVLLLLAHYQGTKDNAYTAEKPGKIMHELRVGEMARLKEIPFTPYYGTVDATPLWLMVCGKYFDQTGDLATIRRLRPNIDRAVQFLTSEVERGSGYLVYGGQGKEALSNQGWKDSGDSIMDADGRLALPPIALAEVQGYLFDAWMQSAKLYRALGYAAKANEIESKARELRIEFGKDFWMPKDSFSALALDGNKQKAEVIASNPGHLLMTGILSPEQERQVSQRLMAIDMFNGFGIRTLSSREKRYFPNSYHNGSVWPHDNAMIINGMRNSRSPHVQQLSQALIDAAAMHDKQRLPELFGGYDRRDAQVPIPYPVACEPQAWAAGTPFMIVSACTGIMPDAPHNTLRIGRPMLPSSVCEITMRNLRVNNKRVDLSFIRRGQLIETRVLANPGKLNILK